ncbi:hypothetical protein CTAYLR_009765 [Chrysophaeum taylorii]|uniref:ARMET N-terminal domain-containing protein n=1 Tax=Chrysophaeum taylorii TaxID=2483200 RepID=A0AAD7UA89_9STRA|nr:hypothetical protein CTAYLR_009765 [Chrysophaeum taylorii]
MLAVSWGWGALALASMQPWLTAAKVDAKECEVCISTVKAVDVLVDSDEKQSVQSIVEAIEAHCGDLQNEKPNPTLGARDLKMCYYMLPIKTVVAEAMAMRMPNDRVCKKLKQKNDEICAVRYPVKVDHVNPEEMLAKLKKMRIKELRGILRDRGVLATKIDNFVEKDEYIKEIIATQHLDL